MNNTGGCGEQSQWVDHTEIVTAKAASLRVHSGHSLEWILVSSWEELVSG